jgi:hypothetical protein
MGLALPLDKVTGREIDLFPWMGIHLPRSLSLDV